MNERSKTVLVTGATGYIASWIVKFLLEKGHTVHAAVRNKEDKEKTKHLDEIASKSKGELKYFESDLLNGGSYTKAMKDCEIVFHTASPFIMDSKNPQAEVIDPAVKGTRNVLSSVNETETVKKVILTVVLLLFMEMQKMRIKFQIKLLMKKCGITHQDPMMESIVILKLRQKKKLGS